MPGRTACAASPCGRAARPVLQPAPVPGGRTVPAAGGLTRQPRQAPVPGDPESMATALAAGPLVYDLCAETADRSWRRFAVLTVRAVLPVGQEDTLDCDIYRNSVRARSGRAAPWPLPAAPPTAVHARGGVPLVGLRDADLRPQPPGYLHTDRVDVGGRAGGGVLLKDLAAERPH
jgi:hypothetical protein